MRRFVYAVVVISVVYSGFCALLKPEFSVERSIEIATAKQDAFAVVASFRNWQHWSPWIEQDSSIEVTFKGPETHVGAAMEWTSKNSGSGSMMIVDFKPYDRIRQELSLTDFDKKINSEFLFQSVENSTKVVWREYAQLGFFERPMRFIYPKFIAPDLERGLHNMKKHLEAKKAASSV